MERYSQRPMQRHHSDNRNQYRSTQRQDEFHQQMPINRISFTQSDRNFNSTQYGREGNQQSIRQSYVSYDNHSVHRDSRNFSNNRPQYQGSSQNFRENEPIRPNRGNFTQHYQERKEPDNPRYQRESRNEFHPRLNTYQPYSKRSQSRSRDLNHSNTNYHNHSDRQNTAHRMEHQRPQRQNWYNNNYRDHQQNQTTHYQERRNQNYHYHDRKPEYHHPREQESYHHRYHDRDYQQDAPDRYHTKNRQNSRDHSRDRGAYHHHQQHDYKVNDERRDYRSRRQSYHTYQDRRQQIKRSRSREGPKNFQHQGYHHNRQPHGYQRSYYQRQPYEQHHYHKKRSSSKPKYRSDRDKHSSYKKYFSKGKHDSRRSSQSRSIDSRSESRSPSSSGSIRSGTRSNGDAGHYKFKIGSVIGRYRIDGHLGDGTFGRALKCLNTGDNKTYAVKVIRAVKRYNESAKIEADILADIAKKGGADHGIVYLKEYFTHKDKEGEHMCLVFETLAQSLYDFIKANKYKGFALAQIQSIARQSLKALLFLHSLQITHTDLKPENILLKDDEYISILDKNLWPRQVLNKKTIYGSERCESESEDERSNDITIRQEGHASLQSQFWNKPIRDEVKLIDFGGATYEEEHHTTIINTRQYRAPEVILGSPQWDMKSDIWSMACILVELYTGEMFFATHENIEHLAMMEKICGPFPLFMADLSKEYRDIFDLHLSEQELMKKGHRLKWPKVARKKESIKNYDEMKTIKEIFYHQEDYPGHTQFRQLLESMLILDPKKRPTAQECINHPFFSAKIQCEDEVKSKLEENEYIAPRQESKSTEKTCISNISSNNGGHASKQKYSSLISSQQDASEELNYRQINQ